MLRALSVGVGLPNRVIGVSEFSEELVAMICSSAKYESGKLSRKQ